MKICEYGHQYDPSLNSQCPVCASLRGFTASLSQEGEGFANDAYAFPKTEPLNLAQEDLKAAGYKATEPVRYLDGQQTDRQLTGWLVCIQGPEKGKDHRLHDEYNYIGRSEGMDVCIAGDDTVSRERHAVIAYVPGKRQFFFAPVGGASIVYHNDAPVLQAVMLSRGDRLRIGKGTFLFVPLCGESFAWEM